MDFGLDDEPSSINSSSETDTSLFAVIDDVDDGNEDDSNEFDDVLLGVDVLAFVLSSKCCHFASPVVEL